MDAKGDAKGIAVAMFMAVLILHTPRATEAKPLNCKLVIALCKATCAITIKPPLCLDNCIPFSCRNGMSAEVLSQCDLRCRTTVCFKRYSDAKKVEDCLDSCSEDCEKSSPRPYSTVLQPKI